MMEGFSCISSFYETGVLKKERKSRRTCICSDKAVYRNGFAKQLVSTILALLAGIKWIMAMLLYGAGLRLMECLYLRVQELDFSANQITVRDGKGDRDSITLLPQAAKGPLQEQLKRVRAIHERNLHEGWGRAYLPDALARKYPNAAADWRWQYVFPAEHRWLNHQTGEQGRRHIHEPAVQRGSYAEPDKMPTDETPSRESHISYATLRSPIARQPTGTYTAFGTARVLIQNQIIHS